MKLTKLGKGALANALLGNELKFTRVALGSGDFDYETEKVYDLTELRKFEMWLPITQIEIKGDGTVYIQAHLSNAEVYQAFAAREHGLYCIDYATGEEILYAYKNVGEEYDFIPSNSGDTVKNIFLDYICEIQDCENVVAVLDTSLAYICRDEFTEHIEAPHAHPNMANVYNEISSAAEFWAASADNHLHKISIENLREALKVDEAEKESAQDIITKSRDELGLNANLLMIEDFKGGDIVTDYFVTQVSSAMAGGTLIAVYDIKNLKMGHHYTISDNINSEIVYIDSILRNDSGYYAKLKNRLENTYNNACTFLYRSTRAGSAKKNVQWRNINFAGQSANIPQILELENAFDIKGDGAIIDNALTLA